jgi:hypothetical protein
MLKENQFNLQKQSDGKMSYFDAPIAPVRRGGKIVKKATLSPAKSLSIEDVYQLITRDVALMSATVAVRCAANVRSAKTELLPYVTPCGEFKYRNSDCLTSLSGYVVVDVDHLGSSEEAESMRRKLFDDPWLKPSLVFVSPGGRGVKAFVAYDVARSSDCAGSAADNMIWAMQYVAMTYSEGDVDTSGKDIVRSCFLCHDSGALLR